MDKSISTSIRTTRKKLLLPMTMTAVSLLSIVILSGCGNPSPNAAEPFGGNKTANTAEAMVGASEQVQSLYKQSCLSCHGNTLEGRVGPKTNLQQVGERLSKEQISKQIASGGNGMPGFGTKLTPEEIAALTDWLATKQ
ncbi:cytochrome c [Paenibacillus sp. S3N08]|uniref:Cytochrome c n=2 Tax=Paenibacillus agricola TaxID=2716264 RepID=A0ABX0J831_9BACL|nr:cytochrome c [Paenibacillus agricola]